MSGALPDQQVMGTRRRTAPHVLCAASVLLLLACPLDERKLRQGGSGGSPGLLGSGGTAGRGGSDPGIAGAGGNTSLSDGGTGGRTGGNGSQPGDAGVGAQGGGGATIDAGVGVSDANMDGGDGGDAGKQPCVYLGGVIMPGCETLVLNPGFQTNAMGWEPEAPDATAIWHAGDAQASPTSGSLAVTNQTNLASDGFGMSGARQCLPITAGSTYDFAASLFTGGGQGMGGGAMSVFFHDGPDCTGTLSKGAVSPTESTVDAWKSVDLQALAPATAKSMLVRLVAVKPFRQPSLIVRFDNVLVRRRQP